MVRNYAPWQLNLPSVQKVTRGWLDEEERFLRDGVVELANVVHEVPANGDDLRNINRNKLPDRYAALSFPVRERMPYLYDAATNAERGRGVG
jgi:hypothetical protein